jgi:hypothetical protein
MKCNLIINADYVKVTIINNSDLVNVVSTKFADANSTVAIPLTFLDGADDTCIAASIGSVSGNMLLLPVQTSNVTVTLTGTKIRVSADNHVPYHITSITPQVQYVTPGQSAQFTLSYAEGYDPSDLHASVGTISNGILTVTTHLDDSNITTKLFRGTEENIELGATSSTTNAALPTNCYYRYGLTQQLYLSDEMGATGTIRTISFKFASSSSDTRNLDIYMDNVDDTNTTTYKSVSNATKVYSGNVTFAANSWTTITLSNPFNYDGSKNMLLTVHDNTGTYTQSKNFVVYQRSGNANNEAISACTDSSAYNLNNISTYASSASKWLTKNSIKMYKFNEIEDEPDPEPVIEPLVIEIGTLTETDTTHDVMHVPSRTDFQYFMSEQIYLAREIGESGTITDIALYYADNSAFTRTWDIYLVHTELSKFPNDGNYYDDSTNAVIHPTSSDLVYSGPVEFPVVGSSAKGWKTIHLDTPFVYDGIHNLCLIVYDKTGTTLTSSHSFKATKTPYANRVSLHTFDMPSIYPNGTQVDPKDPDVVTVANLTRFRNFIQISIIPES